MLGNNEGLSENYRFESATAIIKIEGICTIVLGFINQALEPPPMDEEEANLIAWGSRNFVLRVKEIKDFNFGDDYGRLDQGTKEEPSRMI